MIPTLSPDIESALHELGKQGVEYPEYEARKAEFVQNVELANLKARAAAIEEALRDEFIRSEVADELLSELSDIDKQLETLEPEFGSKTWFDAVPEVEP